MTISDEGVFGDAIALVESVGLARVQSRSCIVLSVLKRSDASAGTKEGVSAQVSLSYSDEESSATSLR